MEYRGFTENYAGSKIQKLTKRFDWGVVQLSVFHKKWLILVWLWGNYHLLNLDIYNAYYWHQPDNKYTNALTKFAGKFIIHNGHNMTLKLVLPESNDGLLL